MRGWLVGGVSTNAALNNFLTLVQVAFAALESLHPISHAVANTIKRVVIIVVSVLVFRNPVRDVFDSHALMK